MYHFDFSRVNAAEWFTCGMLWYSNYPEAIMYLTNKTITEPVLWQEISTETLQDILSQFGIAGAEYFRSFNLPPITSDDINSIFRRAVNGE